ncbi:MAG: hypothetical protein OEZ24_01740 [Candidatus Bathyarchaeota archaeon]|nr:hypothetical protein [Candidatus Bathyarchaeota archaeon]
MKTLTRMQQRFLALDHLSAGTGGGIHEERRAAYQEILRDLKPGVNQITLHLSGDEKEIWTIIGPDAAYRRGDFLIFTETETRQIIKQRRIELIRWRDLVRSSSVSIFFYVIATIYYRK